MNWLTTILLLGAAFLAVFWEASFSSLRHLLGAQIDLLPPLMVYAGLCAGPATVALVAVGGGLCLDALSVNPLGISVLPLFLTGITIYWNRELILREQVFAQAVLGLAASAAVPLMTLLLLLTTGHRPLLGWSTLWQLVVLSAGGGLATPMGFVIFDWLRAWLAPDRPGESSFRPDRELRRGRGVA